MKKIAIMSLLLTVLCISAFAVSAGLPINSKAWENLSPNLRVVNICNLTDTDLNEIMQGHHPETAVEFSAQSTLSISFFLKGDLINLVENKEKFGELEIKQTFYARYIDGNLLLSVDLREWKPLSKFITGNASIALTIQEGKPSILFGSETNRRL